MNDDEPDRIGGTIKTVNLKTGMPTVPEALQHLGRELARARQAG